jgi:hypothetical protein
VHAEEAGVAELIELTKTVACAKFIILNSSSVPQKFGGMLGDICDFGFPCAKTASRFAVFGSVKPPRVEDFRGEGALARCKFPEKQRKQREQWSLGKQIRR